MKSLHTIGGRDLPPRRTASIRHLYQFIAVVIAVLFSCMAARGQYVLDDVHDKDRYGAGQLALPYVFYTPSDRFGGGAIWQENGHLQPQMDSYGLVFGDINGTYGIYGGEDDFQLKPFDRLFLSSEFGDFRYNFDKLYLPGNPRFPRQRAGANRSPESDFVRRRHEDVWGHLTFSYLLPIGGGTDVVVNHYCLENGLLTAGATGGVGWNPLSTGHTYLQLTPFYETQTIETNPRDLHFDENGLRFALVYDNRDFPLNPSSGNISRITFSRDFGLFESSNSWSNVSSEFTQYLDLGRSKLFKQQVLALDLWTSYSITWDQPHRGGGLRILSSSPPFYDGSVLGGDTRLRGFAANRFWDRAAVYGSVELRVVPYWNPLGEIRILKSADIAWMQWVVFLEAGRVGGEYSPALLNHLKGDAGFGVRLLANDTIVRFDVAASNEGFGVWAGLNQPF